MNIIQSLRDRLRGVRTTADVYTDYQEPTVDETDDYYEVAISTTGAPTSPHIHRRWEDIKPVRKTFGKR